MECRSPLPIIFFFNDPATTEIYTLSLHDALPICITVDSEACLEGATDTQKAAIRQKLTIINPKYQARSEEHTSELQSHHDLVCRLLLEKKNHQAEYHK